MKPRSNYMNQVQYSQLLDHVPDLQIRKWKDEDIQMIFRIAYWCGLRMIEARRLHAEDFDLEMKEVYLGKTKTRKEDYAPIPNVFIPDLRQYLRNKKGPLLDPQPTRDTVYKWLIRLGKMLKIQALTTSQEITGEKTKTHIFRKSIGKDMLYGTHRKKASLPIVKKHLRHEKIETIIKYLNADLEEAKDYWNT